MCHVCSINHFVDDENDLDLEVNDMDDTHSACCTHTQDQPGYQPVTHPVSGVLQGSSF